MLTTKKTHIDTNKKNKGLIFHSLKNKALCQLLIKDKILFHFNQFLQNPIHVFFHHHIIDSS